jgi:hypothetical protein
MIMATAPARLALCKKSPRHEKQLGVRRAGNANPAGTYHHKRTGLKRLTAFIRGEIGGLFSYTSHYSLPG